MKKLFYLFILMILVSSVSAQQHTTQTTQPFIEDYNSDDFYTQENLQKILEQKRYDLLQSVNDPAKIVKVATNYPLAVTYLSPTQLNAISVDDAKKMFASNPAFQKRIAELNPATATQILKDEMRLTNLNTLNLQGAPGVVIQGANLVNGQTKINLNALWGNQNIKSIVAVPDGFLINGVLYKGGTFSSSGSTFTFGNENNRINIDNAREGTTISINNDGSVANRGYAEISVIRDGILIRANGENINVGQTISVQNGQLSFSRNGQVVRRATGDISYDGNTHLGSQGSTFEDLERGITVRQRGQELTITYGTSGTATNTVYIGDQNVRANGVFDLSVGNAYSVRGNNDRAYFDYQYDNGKIEAFGDLEFERGNYGDGTRVAWRGVDGTLIELTNIAGVDNVKIENNEREGNIGTLKRGAVSLQGSVAVPTDIPFNIKKENGVISVVPDTNFERGKGLTSGDIAFRNVDRTPIAAIRDGVLTPFDNQGNPMNSVQMFTPITVPPGTMVIPKEVLSLREAIDRANPDWMTAYRNLEEMRQNRPDLYELFRQQNPKLVQELTVAVAACGGSRATNNCIQNDVGQQIPGGVFGSHTYLGWIANSLGTLHGPDMKARQQEFNALVEKLEREGKITRLQDGTPECSGCSESERRNFEAHMSEVKRNFLQAEIEMAIANGGTPRELQLERDAIIVGGQQRFNEIRNKYLEDYNAAVSSGNTEVAEEARKKYERFLNRYYTNEEARAPYSGDLERMQQGVTNLRAEVTRREAERNAENAVIEATFEAFSANEDARDREQSGDVTLRTWSSIAAQTTEEDPYRRQNAMAMAAKPWITKLREIGLSYEEILTTPDIADHVAKATFNGRSYADLNDEERNMLRAPVEAITQYRTSVNTAGVLEAFKAGNIEELTAAIGTIANKGVHQSSAWEPSVSTTFAAVPGAVAAMVALPVGATGEMTLGAAAVRALPYGPRIIAGAEWVGSEIAKRSFVQRFAIGAASVVGAGIVSSEAEEKVKSASTRIATLTGSDYAAAGFGIVGQIAVGGASFGTGDTRKVGRMLFSEEVISGLTRNMNLPEEVAQRFKSIMRNELRELDVGQISSEFLRTRVQGALERAGVSIRDLPTLTPTKKTLDALISGAEHLIQGPVAKEVTSVSGSVRETLGFPTDIVSRGTLNYDAVTFELREGRLVPVLEFERVGRGVPSIAGTVRKTAEYEQVFLEVTADNDEAIKQIVELVRRNPTNVVENTIPMSNGGTYLIVTTPDGPIHYSIYPRSTERVYRQIAVDNVVAQIDGLVTNGGYIGRYHIDPENARRFLSTNAERIDPTGTLSRAISSRDRDYIEEALRSIPPEKLEALFLTIN